MSKEEEIKHLQALKGDTYFAQFFSSQDIDRMCENIKADIAIETYCSFDYTRQLMMKRVAEEMKDKIALTDELLPFLAESIIPEVIEKIIKQHIGLDELLLLKVRHSLPMTEEQYKELEKRVKPNA